MFSSIIEDTKKEESKEADEAYAKVLVSSVLVNLHQQPPRVPAAAAVPAAPATAEETQTLDLAPPTAATGLETEEDVVPPIQASTRREEDSSGLSADCAPSPTDVLCGRGKDCFHWPGNQTFRNIIVNKLPDYIHASTKIAKGSIITSVVDRVRQQGGRFVRQAEDDDNTNNKRRWTEIGDAAVREKIGSVFREYLHEQNIKASTPTAAAAGSFVWKMRKLPIQPTPASISAPEASTRVHAVSAKTTSDSKSKLTAPFNIATRFQDLPNSRLQPGTLKISTKLHALEKLRKEDESASSAKHASKPHALEQSDSDWKRNSTSQGRKRSIADIEARSAAQLMIDDEHFGQLHKDDRMQLQHQQQQLQLFLLRQKQLELERQQQQNLMQHHSTLRGTTVANATTESHSRPPAASDLARERPQKRRSLDEDMAVDALQLIAQAASAGSPSPTSSAPSPKSSVRVCSLQLSHRTNTETPWEATQRALACLTSVAQQEPDVDLFVLPELSPVGSSQNTFTKYLPLSDEWQQLYHRIDEAFRHQARELGVYIVYGTIGWQCREIDRSLKFTLQHKVVDRQGNFVAVYDKSYLSDLEMRFFEPGPRKTVSFSVDGFSFGLLVGDDLKYPNLARSLAREVDVLIHPSAEASPRYFRQCRAVENAVYVLGVEYGEKHCSMSIPPDPDHDLIALETEEEEGYLLTRIQRSALEYARTNFPFYRHMKTEAAVL